MTDNDWQAWKEQRVLVGKMVHAAKLEYIGLHPEVVLSEFYCDACDRGFKSAELLAEHVATHETCGRDGCRFTAQPKVVLKHVQMQHDTGLYLRIRSENPEDVAKWIAERKNRFPTKEHIEKRLAQRKEMFQRGERISSQGRPSFSRHQRENRRENYNNRNNEISAPTQNCVNDCVKQTVTSSQINNKDKWRDFDSWRGDLPKFPGTASFLSLNEDKEIKQELQISDEEESYETKAETLDVVKPVVSGVLAALMADYGSDMTEDEDDESTKSKDVAGTVEKIPKVANNKSALDEHVLLKEEIQMEVSYELQKSVGTFENALVPDKIQEDAGNEREEHNIDYKATLETPVLKPAEDAIKPLDSETAVENETKSSRLNIIDSSIIVADKHTDDSDSEPEEQTIDHNDKSEMPIPKPAEDSAKPVNGQTADRNEPSKMSRPLPVRHRLPRHQLSLLEKLLGNEVRQERNMILQCVHYVVKKNFFDNTVK